MKQFETIQLEIKNQTARLSLNRPKVRNAFNPQMIAELKEAFTIIGEEKGILGLILQGKGPVFSAGADLHWMKDTMDYTYEQNARDNENLRDLFEKLYNLPVPTIALVHGACIGGANGLAAASDIVLAEQDTQFRFSEVRIGLVPATIAPYVIRRTGEFAAKYYMLTGKVFRDEEALRIGLINARGNRESLDTELDIIIRALNKNSLQAMRSTKKLINQICRSAQQDYIKKITVETIAEARISEDGQEGMQSFLEKRYPRWYNE